MSDIIKRPIQDAEPVEPEGGFFKMIRSRIKTNQQISMSRDRTDLEYALADETEARAYRQKASIRQAATEVAGETLLYHLATERDRAKNNYHLNALRSVCSHEEYLTMLQRRKEQLEVEVEIAELESKRRGHLLGRASSPKAPEPIRAAEPTQVLEPAYSEVELDDTARKIWADVHKTAPETRREMMAEAQEFLADRMSPFDAQAVMRRVEVLLQKHG